MRIGDLHLLHHRSAPEEWYVEGIAVAKEMRGAGIGTGLISLLERIAREKKDKQSLAPSLDTNPRAKILYERIGFVETRGTPVWPFNRICGFSFNLATEMAKEL